MSTKLFLLHMQFQIYILSIQIKLKFWLSRVFSWFCATKFFDWFIFWKKKKIIPGNWLCFRFRALFSANVFMVSMGREEEWLLSFFEWFYSFYLSSSFFSMYRAKSFPFKMYSNFKWGHTLTNVNPSRILHNCAVRRSVKVLKDRVKRCYNCFTVKQL